MQRGLKVPRVGHGRHLGRQDGRGARQAEDVVVVAAGQLAGEGHARKQCGVRGRILEKVIF
jgi:hypothetical protein